MTLSGGECLLQPDFAAALLEEAHNRGINTAIETAGNVRWSFMVRGTHPGGAGIYSSAQERDRL
jgi:pyruvate-formate lyase-activating enzyme